MCDDEEDDGMTTDSRIWEGGTHGSGNKFRVVMRMGPRIEVCGRLAVWFGRDVIQHGSLFPFGFKHSGCRVVSSR